MDILSIKMEEIPEVETIKKQHHTPRHVDPYNHYEVECSKLKTLFIGEEQEAKSVYTNSQSTAKALIHVQGKNRIVSETNAPYIYLSHEKMKEIYEGRKA